MNCGLCSNEMIFVDQGQEIGQYYYCRTCKKEGNEIEDILDARDRVANTKLEPKDGDAFNVDSFVDTMTRAMDAVHKQNLKAVSDLSHCFPPLSCHLCGAAPLDPCKPGCPCGDVS